MYRIDKQQYNPEIPIIQFSWEIPLSKNTNPRFIKTPFAQNANVHHQTSGLYLMNKNFHRRWNVISPNLCGPTRIAHVNIPPKPQMYKRMEIIAIPNILFQVSSPHTIPSSLLNVLLSLGLSWHLKIMMHMDAIPAKKVKIIEKYIFRVRSKFIATGIPEARRARWEPPKTMTKTTAMTNGPTERIIIVFSKLAKPAHCGLNMLMRSSENAQELKKSAASFGYWTFVLLANVVI
mmetsp:Transcript_97623/g.169096  ORF Transcript_97623/g.169096 Transcript_97623/m.169096 type:complete len:234 (+) Transcript_97623:922-1623(+)